MIYSVCIFRQVLDALMLVAKFLVSVSSFIQNLKNTLIPNQKFCIFALRYLLEMQTKEQSVVYYQHQFIAY